MKTTGIIMAVVLICIAVYACRDKDKNQPQMHEKNKQSKIGTDKNEQKKIIYHCPMHPTYTSDKPGNCPICGMNLVSVDNPPAKGKGSSENMDMGNAKVEGLAEIQISPEKQQMIGVKTALVSKQNLKKTIKSYGKVDYVEPNVAYVNVKFEGWADKLLVNYTGQFVKRGTPLLEIYSPELVSTQKEYLVAFNNSKSGNANDESDNVYRVNLLESARQRLKLWDISDSQIEKLEKSGKTQKYMTLYSPISGYVIEKNILEGKKVMPGENLYKIADLSSVWINGEVYEGDLPSVKLGQRASVKLSYYPEEQFEGKVSYIYPYLDPEIRTNRIRIEVLNPKGTIKPEMYVSIEIAVDYGEKLSVPKTAVMDSGDRKIAFVALKDGHFEPRKLSLGQAGSDFYEVLSGVEAGESVVTAANFLIDSESNLKSAIEQMNMQSGGHEHMGH